MGRFEWVLIGVAVILAYVAFKSYTSMGDSLVSPGSLPPAANGGFQSQLGFNSLTGRLQFAGGVKL